MDLDARLLSAAIIIGEQHRFDGLVAKLSSCVTHLPGFRIGALAVYDAEREAVNTFAINPAADTFPSDPTQPDPQGSLFDRDDSQPLSNAPESGEAPDTYCSPDLQAERVAGFEDRLYRAGVRRYVMVPMMVKNKPLGRLYAGFEHTDPVPGQVVSYLERLARIATPTLWNCFTDARLGRGDQRRDMLVELTKVINTSLELETVLSLARPLIGKLEGHCVSGIAILDRQGETFQSYRHYGAPDQEQVSSSKPERIPVAASAMAWLLEHGETYQSDDLDRHSEFENEKQLRESGVRRYVGTPLFARGRIIGGFFFGSTDPHPFRRIDVWLYENIAVQLALAIDNAIKHEEVRRLSDRLKEQNVYLREEIQSQHEFSDMIGRAPAMQCVHQAIRKVAATTSTVLITGQTGVGKELVARAIHAGSAGAAHPMVKVNCPAIPEGMVESELFGHERGAFTSAVERRIGRFELACDGTLFLDEIGDLPLAVQAKLLRVLQDGEFERVGGSETLSSNARIIAATNRDLINAVESGAFRSDLYYRLNVFPIYVPSLHERREDIPLLVEAFVSHFCRRMGKRIESIDPASLEYLTRRDWPGNIRELRHVIERAMILCDGPVLSTESAAPEPIPPAGQPAPTRGTEPATLQTVEVQHIRRTLERTRWVIEGPKGAAALLGLKPSTLRHRIKRLDIKRPN